MDIVPNRKWATVLVFHFAAAFSASIAITKGIFFPELVKSFGFSHAMGATLLSFNLVAGAFVSLVGGSLMVRRLDSRSFMLLATALVGIGYIVAGFAQSKAQLVIAYVLMGGASGHLVAIPFILALLFERHRGLAMGIALAGTTTGGVLLVPITAALVQFGGWRVGYWGLGLTDLLVMLPMLALVLKKASPRAGAPVHGVSVEPLPGVDLRNAVRTREYWTIAIVYTVTWAASGSYFLHFIAAGQSVGYSATVAVAIMSALYLIAGFAKVLIGALSDRINLRFVLGASLALASVGLFIFSHFLSGGSPKCMTAFVLVYGLAYSAPMVLVPLLIARIFGPRSFTIIDATLMVTASVIGSGGGIFSGWVFDRTGSYAPAFTTFAIMLAASALLVIFLLRRTAHGRPQP